MKYVVTKYVIEWDDRFWCVGKPCVFKTLKAAQEHVDDCVTEYQDSNNYVIHDIKRTTLANGVRRVVVRYDGGFVGFDIAEV